MKKLLSLSLLLTLLAGCESTMQARNDVDVQYYPAADVQKLVSASDSFTLYNTKKDVPDTSEHMGTLVVIKKLADCENQNNCNTITDNTQNSDQYVEQYAKKLGADMGAVVDMNKVSLVQQAAKMCTQFSNNCSAEEKPAKIAQACTDISGSFTCNYKTLPDNANSCQETCDEFIIEQGAGFQKTQRTIVALYRNKL